MDKSGILTIGYEGRKIDEFLSIIIKNKVRLLIDVRRNAFSRKPGFSKSHLKDILEKQGISYLHLPELGIETSRRQNLTQNGFTKLFEIYALELATKEDLLKSIRSLAQKNRVALMCFEAKEEDCHRGIIAQRFREEGFDVVAL